MNLQKVKDWLDPGNTAEAREDIAYMPDVEAAIRNSGARFAYILTVVTAASIGALER